MQAPIDDIGFDPAKPFTKRPSWWVWNYVVHVAVAVGAVATAALFIYASTVHSHCVSGDLQSVDSQYTFSPSDFTLEGNNKDGELQLRVPTGSVKVVIGDFTAAQRLDDSAATTDLVHVAVTSKAHTTSQLFQTQVRKFGGALSVTHPSYSVFNCYSTTAYIMLPTSMLGNGRVRRLVILSDHADISVDVTSSEQIRLDAISIKTVSGSVAVEGPTRVTELSVTSKHADLTLGAHVHATRKLLYSSDFGSLNAVHGIVLGELQTTRADQTWEKFILDVQTRHRGGVDFGKEGVRVLGGSDDRSLVSATVITQFGTINVPFVNFNGLFSVVSDGSRTVVPDNFRVASDDVVKSVLGDDYQHSQSRATIGYAGSNKNHRITIVSESGVVTLKYTGTGARRSTEGSQAGKGKAFQVPDPSTCVSPFGEVLGSAHGVAAYSNCKVEYRSNQPNQLITGQDHYVSGMKWTASEYAVRFLKVVLGVRVKQFGSVSDLIRGPGAPESKDEAEKGGNDNAVQFTSQDGGTKLEWSFIANDQSNAAPPTVNSLLVYKAGAKNTNGDTLSDGHVAVIVRVSAESLLVVEQNYDNRPWAQPKLAAREIKLARHDGAAAASSVTVDDSGVVGWASIKQ